MDLRAQDLSEEPRKETLDSSERVPWRRKRKLESEANSFSSSSSSLRPSSSSGLAPSSRLLPVLLLPSLQRPWRSSPLTLIFVILLVFLVHSASAAGGDCMGSGTIECFDCNSWDDPRCHDPFNYTLLPEDMPKVQYCEGCCVKMVQFIGTEHYQIKRTCTDSFEVNFFMVNHACMTEGHRHGHMCFCEEDLCNGAPHGVAPTMLLGLVTTAALVLGSRR